MRGTIAWATGVLFVGLFAAALLVGGDDGRDTSIRPNPFGYAMTARQYGALRLGLGESIVVNRLEQAGLPENLTKPRFVRLFPPHSDKVVCSFWEIADRPQLIARVCFSNSQGRLVQKLERRVAHAFGVNAESGFAPSAA